MSGLTMRWLRARWGFWLVVLIGLVFGFVEDALAYEFNGEHWEKDYHYSIGSGCGGLQVFAIETGLRHFAPVPVFREKDTILSGLSEDQVNIIYCSDTEPPSAIVRPGMNFDDERVVNTQNAVIGKARWMWPIGSLEIAECDIWLSTKADVVATMSAAVHELGHCWGLLHSKDNRAVMAPNAATSRPTLDDLAGLAHLYGKCGTVQIDHKGNVFLPAIDSRTLLRELNDPRFKEFEGMVISGYLKIGGRLDEITGIAESKCQ